MASHDFSSIKCPPKFDGLTFPIWKVKMNLFLKSLGVRVAKAMTKKFVEPHSDEDTGPKQPPRTMKQMPKPNMYSHKHLMIMIFHV